MKYNSLINNRSLSGHSTIVQYSEGDGTKDNQLNNYRSWGHLDFTSWGIMYWGEIITAEINDWWYVFGHDFPGPSNSVTTLHLSKNKWDMDLLCSRSLQAS